MATSSSDTPKEMLVLFARGVIARLATWPALRLAVDSGWGGPESAQKRTWIASVIVDAFDSSEKPASEIPDVPYVEEMLLQIMADEFDTELEDGSAEEVAKDVLKLWSALETSDTRLVADWEERAKRLKGQKVAAEVMENENEDEDEEGDESDWEDEEDGVPSLIERQQRNKSEPEVDEDGFTLVKGNNKGHR